MLIKQATFFTLSLLGIISSTQIIRPSNQASGEFADRNQWQEELHRNAKVQQLSERQDQHAAISTQPECCNTVRTYCLPYFQPCLFSCKKCAMELHHWHRKCHRNQLLIIQKII